MDTRILVGKAEFPAGAFPLYRLEHSLPDSSGKQRVLQGAKVSGNESSNVTPKRPIYRFLARSLIGKFYVGKTRRASIPEHVSGE